MAGLHLRLQADPVQLRLPAGAPAPHVELVTDRIARITEKGIVTADGAARELDCLIYATGFRTTEFMFPMEITGAGGTSLREAWADGPHAHLGIAVPGFPSLFLMYGPNTNTSGGSIIFYEETQAAYIRQALEQVRARGAAAIEVRSEVEARQRPRAPGAVRGHGLARVRLVVPRRTGRIVTNWPGYMREYEERLRTLDPAEYELIPAALPARSASSLA